MFLHGYHNLPFSFILWYVLFQRYLTYNYKLYNQLYIYNCEKSSHFSQLEENKLKDLRILGVIRMKWKSEKKKRGKVTQDGGVTED